MSQETPPVTPSSKIDRPNGQRPSAPPKKSLQLTPTTTIIILIAIAAVIFFLPTQKPSVDKVATTSAVTTVPAVQEVPMESIPAPAVHAG